MIRVFYAFGKSLFNKISDLSLFLEASACFSPDSFVCPKCGRKHDADFINPYSRYLITFESGAVVTHSVQVKQLQCASCNSIHAVLPDHLVPYSSYSLSFILTVLRSYFFRSCTIEALCLRFQIVHSTLYAWLRLFQTHKQLWLGLLRDSEISPIDFISQLFSSQFRSEQFVHSFDLSLMQGAFTSRFNSS